jgi:hypothetical protein
MQITKNFLFLTLALSLYAGSAHALIGDGVDTRTVSDLNVPAPEDIANIQMYSNREINYMVKNYSVPQMAKYVIEVNKAQIATAKMNGNPLPPRLTKEILSDKNKMADYLRSQYKFSY